MEEALAIQRESEVIQLTGWTFAQYDEQPADRLARMMLYISTKHAVEKEKQDRDNRSGGSGGLTGQH